MDVEVLAQRQFGPDEILPWEHLGGPEKKYLLSHLDKAMKETKNEKRPANKFGG
ncbi:hypothetical protein ES703_71245 [subsurface metagenome]